MTRLSTGVKGLDEVLLGGLPAGRIFLMQGRPGAGKTTLGLQFLLAGSSRGESTLFVTLSESEDELRQNAESHGWDLTGVHFLDIRSGLEGGLAEGQYTIFHPADVELIPAVQRVYEAIEQYRPTRIVFDSLTQIRLLSRDTLRYRRQIVGLKTALLERGITALFLGEGSADNAPDAEVASIVQGVLELALGRGQEGLTRRSIEVLKLRGTAYREGQHSLRIEQGGLRVFPRLLALEHGQNFRRDPMATGIASFDRMLGGGLDRGTCTLITGNAGVGKTTLCTTILAHAASQGVRSAVYTFDEGPAEILYRGEAIGLQLTDHVAAGLIQIQKVNPLILYPDEFAAWIRTEVEERGTQIIMLDSLNGYNQSMPDERFLNRHMHQLIGYLNRMGVTTLLVNEVSNIVGPFSATDFGLSYMADSVIVIRFYEYDGSIRRAISILKKRLSDHEKNLRDFEVTPQGVRVGDGLPNLLGILRGEAINNQLSMVVPGGGDA